MGTTAHGLRYPEPTDPVTAGATAIRNLATDTDARIETVAAALSQLHNDDISSVTDELADRYDELAARIAKLEAAAGSHGWTLG